MKKSFWLILVLCLVVGTGCKGKPKENTDPVKENPAPTAQQQQIPTPPPVPIQNTTQQQPAPQQPQQQQPQPVDLVPVYRQFAGKLYAQVAANHEGENFVFSPLAAFQEMGILLLATEGKTKENIQRLFAAPQLKASEMGALFGFYMGSQGMITKLESALWLQKEYPVIKLFTERIDKAFGAKIYSADLLGAKEESLRLINAWSADMTGDTIPTVVSDYPDQTRLMLTNLLMHRVNWQEPFEMSETADREFTLASGEKVTKSMMHKTGEFPCYQSEKIRMLVLRYLEPQFRLVVFMPTGDLFGEFEQKAVAAQKIEPLFGQLQPTWMTLGIPRLEMENELDLSKIFAKPFESPNLKGMSQSDLEPLTIGPVVQKTRFRMDETGNSAAQTPQLPAVPQSPRPETIEAITLDQPFIFAVWHTPSMTPIIMGRVVK